MHMTETLTNGLLIVAITALLGAVGYCIKKIWDHDSCMATFRAQIASIMSTCVNRGKTISDQDEKLDKIDKSVTKVVTILEERARHENESHKGD